MADRGQPDRRARVVRHLAVGEPAQQPALRRRAARPRHRDRAGARVGVVRRLPGRRAEHRLERRDPGGRAGDEQLRDRHVRGARVRHGRGAAGAAVRPADAADRAARRRDERAGGAAAHPGRPGRRALVAAALGGPRPGRDVGAAAARPGHGLRALHAGGAHHRPAGTVGRAGARGGVASGDHRPEPGRDAGPAARPPAGPARAAPPGRAGPGQHRGTAPDDGRPGRGRGPQVGHRQPPGAGAAADGRGLAGRGLAAPLPVPDPGVDRRHDQRERGHRPARSSTTWSSGASTTCCSPASPT